MKLLQEDPVEKPGKIQHGLMVPHLRGMQEACSQANDRDRVVIITGVEGIGKSGVGEVAMEVMDPKMDPDKQIHWTGPPYQRSSETLAPGKPLMMDELVRVGTNYKFMSEGNSSFNDYLYTNRHRRHPQILCHPDLDTVDPRIVGHRAWEHWHVVRRYREHTVVKIRQLRDEATVYERPKHLFTTTMPKPRGPKWRRMNELKRQFTGNLAEGRTDQADVFRHIVDDMKARMRIF